MNWQSNPLLTSWKSDIIYFMASKMNKIPLLKVTSKREIQVHIGVYQSFIDYANGFFQGMNQNTIWNAR